MLNEKTYQAVKDFEINGQWYRHYETRLPADMPEFVEFWFHESDYQIYNTLRYDSIGELNRDIQDKKLKWHPIFLVLGDLNYCRGVSNHHVGYAFVHEDYFKEVDECRSLWLQRPLDWRKELRSAIMQLNDSAKQKRITVIKLPHEHLITDAVFNIDKPDDEVQEYIHRAIVQKKERKSDND